MRKPLAVHLDAGIVPGGNERAVQLGGFVGQQLQKPGWRDFVFSRECLHRKALLPQNAHGCGGVTAAVQP